MKYAHYDSTSKILGYYDSGIHESIPEPTIELTEEQWSAALSGGHNTVAGGETTFVPYVPTAEEDAAALIAAKVVELKHLESVDRGTIRLLITLIQSLLANGTIQGSDFTADEVALYQKALSLKGELW